MLCHVGQVRPGRLQAIDGLLDGLLCLGAARHGVPFPQIEGDRNYRADVVYLQPLACALESVVGGRRVGELPLVQALPESAKSVPLKFEDGCCRP